MSFIDNDVKPTLDTSAGDQEREYGGTWMASEPAPEPDRRPRPAVIESTGVVITRGGLTHVEGRSAMVETVLPIMAAGGGVIMGLAPVLQVRRMLAESSSQDVSIGFFVVFLINFLIWLAYGMSIGSRVIVLPNIISASTAALTIVIAARLRTSSQKAT